MIAPDERTLRDHLDGGRFQAGVAAGRWRLHRGRLAARAIAISAAAAQNSPAEFVLRLELNGYPQRAPTGSLWDTDADARCPPSARPKGDGPRMLFRTDGWAGGATAMYAPWDRIGLQAHPDWARNTRIGLEPDARHQLRPDQRPRGAQRR